jgi:hypothetical protein
MAYSKPWDETQPLGSAAADTIDTIIQDLKTSVRERLEDLIGDWGTDATDPKTMLAGLFAQGAVGTPSIASRTYPDTGFFFDADGRISVAIDGVLLGKFEALGYYTDFIKELTAAAGVTIDQCLIKDGHAASAKGLLETGGQALAMGAVADGQLLKRVGTSIVGSASGQRFLSMRRSTSQSIATATWVSIIFSDANVIFDDNGMFLAATSTTRIYPGELGVYRATILETSAIFTAGQSIQCRVLVNGSTSAAAGEIVSGSRQENERFSYFFNGGYAVKGEGEFRISNTSDYVEVQVYDGHGSHDPAACWILIELVG